MPVKPGSSPKVKDELPVVFDNIVEVFLLTIYESSAFFSASKIVKMPKAMTSMKIF